jgi:hypothetical protein
MDGGLSAPPARDKGAIPKETAPTVVNNLRLFMQMLFPELI